MLRWSAMGCDGWSKIPCCCLPVGMLKGRETGRCRERGSRLLELILAVEVVVFADCIS